MRLVKNMVVNDEKLIEFIMNVRSGSGILTRIVVLGIVLRCFCFISFVVNVADDKLSSTEKEIKRLDPTEFIIQIDSGM